MVRNILKRTSIDGILHKIILSVYFSIILVLLFAPVSEAATQINSCAVISLPGAYTLNQNIMDSAETYCINISSSDVLLDGAGRSIDGRDTAGTYGIYVHDPANILTNVTIKNLVVKDWANGLYFNNVRDGRIYDNNVSSNDRGIYFTVSSNNTIYNNYFSNTDNTLDDGNNAWNISKTMGQNIVLGPMLGGNYWSDYSGIDTDGDGLGNTLLPYNSSGAIVNGGDYLPLTIPLPVITPTPSLPPPPPPIPVLNDISVSPLTVLLVEGDAQTFTAHLKDQFGNPIDATVTWGSSNATVGTITPGTHPGTGIYTGVFNAIREGTTTITATDGTVSGAASVTVKAKPVCSAVDVLPATATFIIEDPRKFYAVPKDQYGDPMKAAIIWNSTNPNVGAIDPVTGVFTAIRPGITTINASCGNASGTATATVKTTQFYQFDIVGNTGQLGITAIGDGPSINDMGNVAFSASVGYYNTIFMANGSPAIPKQITPMSSRRFNDKVMINSKNHVMTSFIVAGNPPASYIALFDPILYDRYVHGSADYYATNLARGGGIMGSYYDAVGGTGGSFNDNDQIAYTAYKSQELFVTGPSPEYGGTRKEISIPLSVRSMMADNGNIVLRGSGTSLTEPINLYSYDLNLIGSIAGTGMGFTATGSNPGISSNGRVVAFYGDLSPAGAAALNTTPGPGIFASVDEGTGGSRRIIRVTGQKIENTSASPGDDDGICDAGEACILADLGFDASGNPVFFNSYDTSSRVGVIHQSLGAAGLNEDTFLVSFLATPNAAIPTTSNDQKGLWTARVDVGQRSGAFIYNTSVPMKVAQVNDVVGGRTVTDIKVHDQIANIGGSATQHGGDNRVAFWASNPGTGAAMVVRATKVNCGPSTTARRITTLGASGPSYATPDKDIILNINYIGTSNCAKYYFRAFGRYGIGPWELLGSESLEAGSYAFPMSIRIPRSTGNENTFTIRIVGQSQRWPNASSYDMMKEITVNMLYIKEIRIEGTPNPNNLTTESDITYTAVLSWNAGAKVNWISVPIGTRLKQTSTAGKPNIPNSVKIDASPWTERSPRDTHGRKNVTARVTWNIGGQIYTDEKQRDFNLSFRKESQDFGGGDPPCTGYRNVARGDLRNCDNWFRYWSNSDDAANTHNRTRDTPTEWTYRGGLYTGNQFGASSPVDEFGDATFPYVALYNRASRNCNFNIILPPVGPAILNFNNKGRGVDCLEDTIGHELGHIQITRNWNTAQAAGGWQGLADADGDRIPDVIEDGTRLLDGLNYNMLGFDPNNANSIPGFPYGNDEEIYGEIKGWGRTGTHSNDWADPGKMSNPAYKRIVVENGTDAALNETFLDFGLDTNSNGLYDYLMVGVGVNVTDAGTYTLFGNIYDSNGNMLWAENFTYLHPGNQLVLLKFDGLLIRKYRISGNLNITDLTLFSKTRVDEDVSLNKSLYVTSFYNYTQFERPEAEFAGNPVDHGIDTNGNGLYEKLAVTVGIDITRAGNYTIQGNIESEGITVGVAQNYSYMFAGHHNLDLVFNGYEIRTHRRNAPYKLGLLRVRNSDYQEVDVLYSYYNTSAYLYTQFERSKAEFTQNFTDIGLDTDGDGYFNYLTLRSEIDVITPGTYRILASLQDSNYAGITSNTTTAYLPAGKQTISLPFDGMAISDHGINGSYKISALALEDENGNMVSYALYSLDTSFYNYTEFQKSSSVTGTIRDSGGIPLPGVDVYLIGNIVSTTLSDSSGRYGFTGLKPGNYTIEANPSDPNLKGNSSFVYLSGGQALKINFTLQPAGSIAGRVMDVTGNPIQDAVIYLSGFEMPRFTTDINGSYSIPGLGEGTYEVNVDATDLNFFEKSSAVSVIPGQTTVVDFTLQKAPDDTPPGGVTNLKSIAIARNYINWTWNDPADKDFAYVEVWIDGVFRENVAKGVQFYNASGLTPGSSHTISTRTVDTSGNINPIPEEDTAGTALLLIWNKSPSPDTAFPKDTSNVALSLQTNVVAECRLSNITNEFTAMENFDFTNSMFHLKLILDPENGRNYTFFINCVDQNGIQNDTEIFTFYIHNRTFLPPEVEQIPDITGFENDTVIIPVDATDPENDPLTITVRDRPVFGYVPIASRITVEDQVLKLRTNFEDAGKYYLRAEVSDGKDTVARDFTLNVINKNRPPSLFQIGSRIATEGAFFTTTITASDPDGDDLRFSDNTSLFNINPFSGVIAFTPKNYHAGDHYVNISVSDGEYTAYEVVLFHIKNVNNPPVISPIFPQKAIANESFILQINATDPDNDQLNFSDDTDLFNISQEGIINFTPAKKDIGNYLINITVTDSMANDTNVLNLVISGISRTPVILQIPETIIVHHNESFEINVTACDPGIDAGCN